MHFLINNVCNSCPEGTTFNEGSKSCVSICDGINEVYNKGCVCKTGTFRINNICGTCPTGQVYDEIKKACVNLSQNFCPPRSEWNSSKLTCVCTVSG